jgi:hypothetical protein
LMRRLDDAKPGTCTASDICRSAEKPRPVQGLGRNWTLKRWKEINEKRWTASRCRIDRRLENKSGC